MHLVFLIQNVQLIYSVWMVSILRPVWIILSCLFSPVISSKLIIFSPCNSRRHTANVGVNAEANCKIASLRRYNFAKAKKDLFFLANLFFIFFFFYNILDYKICSRKFVSFQLKINICVLLLTSFRLLCVKNTFSKSCASFCCTSSET